MGIRNWLSWAHENDPDGLITPHGDSEQKFEKGLDLVALSHNPSWGFGTEIDLATAAMPPLS